MVCGACRACLPRLQICVEEMGLEKSCFFVSPFTLVEEIEGLLAHWTDSLLTAVDPVQSHVIRLRQEHPTVSCACCGIGTSIAYGVGIFGSSS